MKVCDPAVFIMHDTIGIEKNNRILKIHKIGEIPLYRGPYVLNVLIFAPKMQLLSHDKQLNSKIFFFI